MGGCAPRPAGGGLVVRLRKKPGIREALLEFAGIVVAPRPGGGWAGEFGRTAPLHVELGVGKGTFISELAAREPGLDFVGIEAQPEVLYQAAKKVMAREVRNVRLLDFDVSGIVDIFAPGEVSRLYINFCDPWPKKRHAKRRLTDGRFLEKYRAILVAGGELFFKTDNAALFAFSLEEFAQAGLEVRNVTSDLPAGGAAGEDVMTEYEQRFRALGLRINRCEVVFP
jgi:tRNA (guanine-N7-)-methyltransferase